jgi:hypothetical protein
MADITAPPNAESPLGTKEPDSSRWQFSLKRICLAMAAVAVVYGLAYWGGWACGCTAAFFAAIACAAVFSPTVRSALLGDGILIAAIGLSLPFAGILFGMNWHEYFDRNTFWVFSFFFFAAAFLGRIVARLSFSSLVLSLLLAEIYSAVSLVDPTSDFLRCAVLFQAKDMWCMEQFYFIAPWLLGAGIGESIVRIIKKIKKE